MEGKYVLIPVIKVKHIHIFLLSSRILESLSTALHDGIDEGLMPCNIAVIYVTVHNFNAVFHKVMVSLRSAKEKISPCATDGLFQQTKMLGNIFLVHVLSSSFFYSEWTRYMGTISQQKKSK